MTNEQYQMICVRRQAFDSFVWQTPPLAIAAQAFLLTASFDRDTDRIAAMILAFFSAWVGLASFQLIVKHRQCELEDSQRLRDFEDARDDHAKLHGQKEPVAGVDRNWITRLSSFRIWSIMMLGFPVLAAYAAVSAWSRPH